MITKLMNSDDNCSPKKIIEYDDDDDEDEDGSPNKIIEYDEDEDDDKDEPARICPKELFEKLPKNGKKLVKKADDDSNAQYRVGVNFYNGLCGYPRNIITGRKFIQKAVVNGNEAAALFYGEKVKKESKNGKKEYEIAQTFINENKENKNAAFDILKGMIYLKQNKYKDALKSFKSGYSKGSLKSCYQIGIMYRDGLGVEKDDSVAQSYFIKSKKVEDIKNETKDKAKNEIICPEDIFNQLSNKSKLLVQKADNDNDNEAQLQVAKNFIDGVGTYPQNRDLGIKYLQKSILNGNEKAVIYYYENVIESSEDIKKAKKFVFTHQKNNNPSISLLNGFILMKQEKYEDAYESFLKSYNKGSSQAAFQLGVFYRDGLGVQKDSKESTNYFLEAKKLKDSSESLCQKGIECMQKKNVSQAINFFKSAAQKGNVYSMKELYNIFFNGFKPIEFNYKKALKYAKMAADLGDLESIINVAALYNDGCKEKGINPNLPMAIKYYNNAADLGDVESMYKYALMLANGEGTEANPKLACKYYQMAADKGNKFAMYEYALMLIQGNGTKKKNDRAMKYLRKSSSLGYKKAKDKLNLLKIKKLKKEIEHDNTKSMIKLAQLYIEGKTVKKDLKLAHSYLIRALKKGDKDARIELRKLKEIQLIELNDPKEFSYYGKSFEFPKNKKNKDLEKAQFWYKKAADLNFIPGILNYCRLLDSKLRDYRMAIKNKQKAPMSKDEFKETEKEMMTNYKKAADKGNSKGLFHYGLCLQHGNGLKVNMKKAVEYYKKAADKGLAIAMSNYAICLERGLGVEKDEREALKWYKKAMNHGLEKAKGEYNYLYIKLNKEKVLNEEEDKDDDNIVDEEEEEFHHNNNEEEDYDFNEEEGEKEDNADEENEEEDNDVDENDDDDLTDDDKDNADEENEEEDNDVDENDDDDLTDDDEF